MIKKYKIFQLETIKGIIEKKLLCDFYDGIESMAYLQYLRFNAKSRKLNIRYQTEEVNETLDERWFRVFNEGKHVTNHFIKAENKVKAVEKFKRKIYLKFNDYHVRDLKDFDKIKEHCEW